LTGGSPLWRKGVSGNPSGKSKVRRELETAFGDALAGMLPPAELASLLVEAARKNDAFALSRIADYYLPSLKDKAAADKEKEEASIQFDFEVLAAEQRGQLEALLIKCRKKPA